MNMSTNEVLKALFKPNDTIYFRVVEDKRVGEFKGGSFFYECGRYMYIEEKLKHHNSMDHGIFFMVNFGGEDDKSISRINAQFVELNNGSIEDQQKKISAFPLKPSMIVRMQKSYQVYWFMDPRAKVDRFGTIQMQLVKYFNGNPSCVNASRLMRLPGYMYYDEKENMSAEVECVSFHPECRYTQNQLSDVLPEIKSDPIEHKSGREKGIDQVMHSCIFLQHCRNDAAFLSEQDRDAMITNLAPFEGGTKMIHDLSAVYPGYNEIKTQKKINYFLENEIKPITCKTIYEKGFKCPKYVAGECPVKAPAAWCYQPRSVEELLDILHGLPFARNNIADMETARQFILDYLYSQNEVIADVIINTEIRSYFNLKASFLKSLNSVYRNANKEYQKNKKEKNDKIDTNIPDWYEQTEKGLNFLPGVLAKNMAEQQHVFYAAGQYFLYHGGVYVTMTEMEAQHMVQEKMLVRKTRIGQIKDAEQQWRLLVQKDVRELNPNPFMINVRNGLYDIVEKTLMEHTPDYYSTIQLNLNYNQTADCPLFKKYLFESMKGDMEQVKLLQEILGYFLIPVNSAQKCFVIVGVAGSGKSLLLRVVNEVLLGRQNVSNVTWQDLNERFKTAELFGKLANIFADLPSKKIDDNGIFKALVGEDYLTVEKKNKDPFSFQSTARLLFSCNSMPLNNGDKSEGFYRRLIIIRFENEVPDDKRDPQLFEKFCKEADGIFMFALEGLHRLINNDYHFSATPVNVEELQKYREESNLLASVQAFVNERCEFNVSYTIGSTELYDYYVTCCNEHEIRPVGQKSFVRCIINKFKQVTRGKDSKNRFLAGITLAEMKE